MVTWGLGFALLSAFAWTGLDATRKALTPSLSTEAIVLVFGLGQVPLFATWAWWAGGGVTDPRAYLAPGLGVLVLNLLANLLFVTAVRVSPFTLTVPFLSFSPVFTAAVAQPLLGEAPSAIQLAGAALVVVGALALNAAPSTGAVGAGLAGAPRRLLRALVEERGSLLMVVVALLWSGSGVLDKVATRHASVPVHAAIQNAAMAALVFAWLAGRRRLGELGGLTRAPGWVLASVLFAAAALGFQLLAIQQTLVAVVETVKRGVGNVMSAVLGRVLFREQVTRSRAAALGVMVLGTVLVTLG